MAITLAEASKLSSDVLLVGVIETIIKDSPVLQKLPFIEIVGNGLTYNRESTLPTVAWYDENEDWGAETAPTFEQVTAGLEIVGANADVDNFIKATRSSLQDVEAAVIELNAKAVRHEFEDTFINGQGTPASKDFEGIDKVCQGTGQTVSMGDNGGPLTLDRLDELVDMVKGGKPELLLMSRRSRRSLNQLSRAAGSYLQVERDEWGAFIELYNGIPVAISDWIADDKVVGTSSDCSTIYAFQMGEGTLCGLTSPGGIQLERVGQLEAKDATRTRIKWYVGLALFSTIKLARLIGVRPLGS